MSGLDMGVLAALELGLPGMLLAFVTGWICGRWRERRRQRRADARMEYGP